MKCNKRAQFSLKLRVMILTALERKMSGHEAVTTMAAKACPVAESVIHVAARAPNL